MHRRAAGPAELFRLGLHQFPCTTSGCSTNLNSFGENKPCQLKSKSVKRSPRESLPHRERRHALATSRGGCRPKRTAGERRQQRAYNGVNPLCSPLRRSDTVSTANGGQPTSSGPTLGCQVNKRPYNVEPGHWGTGIVFFKPIRKTVVDEAPARRKKNEFFMLANLYGVQRRSGYRCREDSKSPRNRHRQEQPDYAPAEELIAATGADIRHGGENAFYTLTGDYIQLPNRERFGSLGAYYETGIARIGPLE